MGGSGGKGGDLGQAAAPVRGADPAPGTGRAELCQALCSPNTWISPFASKCCGICFSTEAGEQLTTTQI